MLALNTLPPLSLYIHIPWCVKKCPYCDFNSHESKQKIPEAEYVAALLRDLEQDLPLIWGRRVQSVYIGGGTPSLFSPKTMHELLSQLRARLNFLPDCEISMEANPGSLELERFEDYQQAGINRLSVGVQSFGDQHLKSLGRIHDSKQANRAIETALQAGFRSVNLDLMFGLPGQTINQAQSDIDHAINLAPQHISLYQLTIEKNTYFHARPPALPEHDDIGTMQEILQSRLAETGYLQYEVSAYAKKGEACKHNLNYWHFGDYLGIGAGAHGKITNHESIQRLWKIKHPQSYMEQAGTEKGIGEQTKLSRTDLVTEFMMNALRLTAGFDSSLFQETTGINISEIQQQLKQAEDKKLIDWDTKKITPTKLGKQFLDDLMLIFINENK